MATEKSSADGVTMSKDCNRHRVIDSEVRKAGLRGKINAKCCECIYDPYQEGSWRKQVENCTSPACPLYTVRPQSKGVQHGSL